MAVPFVMLRALRLIPARLAHGPGQALGWYGDLDGGGSSGHRRLERRRDIERQPTVV